MAALSPPCQVCQGGDSDKVTGATSWVPREWGQQGTWNCFRFILGGTKRSSAGIPKVGRAGRSNSRVLLGSQRWKGMAEVIPELIWDLKGGKGCQKLFWDSQGGKGLQKLFPSSFGIPKALSGICAGSHFHVGQTLGTRAVCCDPKDKDSTRGQGSVLTSMPGFPGGPSSPGAPGSPLTPWKREKKGGISLG